MAGRSYIGVVAVCVAMVAACGSVELAEYTGRIAISSEFVRVRIDAVGEGTYCGDSSVLRVGEARQVGDHFCEPSTSRIITIDLSVDGNLLGSHQPDPWSGWAHFPLAAVASGEQVVVGVSGLHDQVEIPVSVPEQRPPVLLPKPTKQAATDAVEFAWFPAQQAPAACVTVRASKDVRWSCAGDDGREELGGVDTAIDGWDVTRIWSRSTWVAGNSSGELWEIDRTVGGATEARGQ